MNSHWEIEVTAISTNLTELISIIIQFGIEEKDIKKLEDQGLSINHPQIHSKMKYQEAYTLAQNIITSINFIIQKFYSRPDEIIFKDLVLISYDEKGCRHLSCELNESITFSFDTEIYIDINGKPDAEIPAKNLTNTILNNPSVLSVVKLLSQKPEWSNFYKAIEIIAEDIGGLDKIYQFGWATKQSIKRFKHTSNSPSAIGTSEARHGIDQGKPPLEPMTYGEAKALVDTICCQWIEYKNSSICQGTDTTD